MSDLRAAQQQRMRAEQQRAVRALLARPLVTASGSTADDFALVRRHDTELRRFFADQVGWMLQVDREMARLRKLPGQLADGSRPARARAKDPAFSPRRYVLLCLALAALERSDRQTTLHRVAEQVAAMVAEAETKARAWDAARATVSSRIRGRPWLESWLDDLVADGVWRRAAGGDPEQVQRLATAALQVIDRFPQPGTALPELAARHYGDAHALDQGRELGLLVVRAAAAYSGLESWQRPEDRRECWASVGILCDELSAPVLTLNLGGHGDGLTDRVLHLHHDAGEACSLSLRQLLRHPPVLDHLEGREVFVCENPTVVAVAVERLATGCAPLVWTSGQARTATRVLLRRLAEVGARLRVQADFDIDGIHIASKSLALRGAQPWRMFAADYRAATPGPPLRRDQVPDTPWDEPLARTMATRGVGVHEETILQHLLGDLHIREH